MWKLVYIRRSSLDFFKVEKDIDTGEAIWEQHLIRFFSSLPKTFCLVLIYFLEIMTLFILIVHWVMHYVKSKSIIIKFFNFKNKHTSLETKWVVLWVRMQLSRAHLKRKGTHSPECSVCHGRQSRRSWITSEPWNSLVRKASAVPHFSNGLDKSQTWFALLSSRECVFRVFCPWFPHLSMHWSPQEST